VASLEVRQRHLPGGTAKPQKNSMTIVGGPNRSQGSQFIFFRTAPRLHIDTRSWTLLR